jgi:DNA-binding beta-propeller fold protein YncE
MEEQGQERGVRTDTLIKILVLIILIGIIGLLYFYFYLLPKRGGGLVEAVPQDVGAIRVFMVISGPGVQPNPYFRHPNDVATDKSGNIYVTDGENNRVCVFNRYGRHLFSFGTEGRAKVPVGGKITWRPGRFWLPYGIDVDDEGNIYVADTLNDRIQVFSPTGRPLDWFPKNGTIHATGLSISGNEIYVADSEGHLINVFDLKGNFKRTIGTPGREPGKLDGPLDVVVGKSGTVYVSDGLNMTVTAFTKDGKVKWVYGEVPAGLRGETPIDLASGLAVDDKENVYLVDAFGFCLQVLNKNGKPIAKVGHRGVNPGEFNFSRGLTIDNEGYLYVVDWGNDRIQKIKITKFTFEEG